MTRFKWLQLTPVLAALTSLSTTAVAADPPKQPAAGTPTSTTQTTQATAPAPSPDATSAAPTTVTTQAPAPQAAPPAADELPPGSFKIPGTKTTLTLSGYAQLDVMYDFKGRDPNIEGNDYAIHAGQIPLDYTYESREKGNQLYMTARTSRIGFSTKTESDIADIGVKIEGDFNSGNLLSGQTFTNSVLFRLRHGYGTLSGKYGTLLIGQSWSTFLDLPSYAETVDFNGPGDIALIRQPQIRYTIPLPSRFTLALAVENAPGTDQNGITSTTPTRREETIPDLVAVLGVSGDWGSASVGGVTINYKDAAAPPPAGGGTPADGYSKQAWGGRAAAAIKLPWGDTFRGLFVGGRGIGRYIFNAGQQGQGVTDTGSDAAGGFVLWDAIAYHVDYTHVWSPILRSNVVWSQTYFKNNGTVIYTGTDANVDNLNSRIDQLFINTFFTLTKQVEFGLEYSFNQRHTFSAVDDQSHGTQHRIASYAHFNFF
ncbi:MAG TPA: DcaP family trimeric outer membrane transporter [Polyangiaceae bacterium]|nr:DcaP family trimeric outer membrane transporter [Polyangiaceae bacterium]